MSDALASLPFDLHDAWLITIQIGPRRDLTLAVALDEPGWIDDHRAHIRFGGITNLEEVRAFFRRVPPVPRPHAYEYRIYGLDRDPTEPQRAHRLAFRLLLEYHDELTVRCRNVVAWRDVQGPPRWMPSDRFEIS